MNTNRNTEQTKEGYNMDKYKIEQLQKMLSAEQKQEQNEQYGAHLTHWAGTAKPINIDAGALQALIDYYKSK